ncbi:MAG: hypothetical protein MAG431_02511 [Chloroflexi bacterium]|nr:hypothetical protein [Chloroflexota bacterium]
MLNGVIVNKLQSMDQTLDELRSLGTVSVAQLENDWLIQRAIERNLQVLVEIVIDVCQRILVLENQTPASTSADAIERCVQLGALSGHDSYRKMEQFRNFIVHRYEKVDTGILVGMVNKRLADFERFRDEILDYGNQDRLE